MASRKEKIKEPNNSHLVGYYDVAGGKINPSEIIDDTNISDNKTWSSSKIASDIKVNPHPVYLGNLPTGESRSCIIINPILS